jgi:DNA-binding PadR family transcriptional regulator
MTLQTQLVLRAFLSDPQQQRYGLELCDLIGLPSGTIYPILARLELVGWLESGWEEAVATIGPRPRRRYYRLSRHGAEQAGVALAHAYRSHGQPRAGWGAQPGMGGVMS